MSFPGVCVLSPAKLSDVRLEAISCRRTLDNRLVKVFRWKCSVFVCRFNENESDLGSITSIDTKKTPTVTYLEQVHQDIETLFFCSKSRFQVCDLFIGLESTQHERISLNCSLKWSLTQSNDLRLIIISNFTRFYSQKRPSQFQSPWK